MNKTVLDCFGKLTTSKIEFKIQEAIIISNKRFNNSAQKAKIRLLPAASRYIAFCCYQNQKSVINP
ncbi:hypothetical protein FFWV33_14100 [Flavobacterium faecale]|uniref:Uncharacterized protein n=1 Tax=Flavobacterium faecale TaxID=1355330 RepID=A0A2S1LFV0_9FLAO|nr:hypothetical protein FFWV33_14100 [Flavobacterium faecale]